MKIYRLHTKQNLPISLQEAWDLLSDPKNLQKITPPDMGFIITSDKADAEEMYAGQIITYIIKPMLGIPVKWMTEITHVKEGEYFYDVPKKKFKEVIL
jgi:ligand-binding SRPBCC domain-containing protein